MIQGTKPQTLAYSQTDSPMGLAAWIVEKFHSWTLSDKVADPPFSMDWLLANVTLYWLNGSAAPSWLYLFLRDPSTFTMPPGAYIHVPSGFTFFPGDMMPPPPRSWIERGYNLKSYAVEEHGGHFPAVEKPHILMAHVRNFLGSYR